MNGDEERPTIKHSLESYHENFNFAEKNEEKNFSTPHRPPPPSHWAFLVKTLQQLLIKKEFSSSDFVITSRTNRAKYDCGAR